MRALASIVLVALLAGAAVSEGEDVALDPERLEPKSGTWWYGMRSPEGKPCGYAKLTVGQIKNGHVVIDWELSIGFPGGSYREVRAMHLDDHFEMLSASYRIVDGASVTGKRVGNRFVVESRAKAEAEPVKTEVDAPDDAVAGMGFVLAAWMPREPGLALSRSDFNEASGFLGQGTVVLRAVRSESLPGAALSGVFRFELTREKRPAMPIWVNEKREIVRIDFGGGNVLDLSRTSTEHWFEPTPPAVVEQAGGPGNLVLRGEYPDLDPAVMFSRWTDSEQIVRWWPPKAEIDPKVGGRFHLSWPGAGWLLKGKITAFEPGKKLGFTWRWDHDEEGAPEREVIVGIEPREGGGCVLTITHGPYGETEAEAGERKGHKQGWEAFCTKLKLLGR